MITIVPDPESGYFKVVGNGADFVGSRRECERYVEIYKEKLKGSPIPNRSRGRELKGVAGKSFTEYTNKPLDDAIKKQIADMHAHGLSVSDIIEELGVSRRTVYNYRKMGS
jgi:DNA invertase Pin-like site-specific DNA recombinase